MKECTKCGGSRLRDYAVGCEHAFAEPTKVGKDGSPSGEILWRAQGHGVDVRHPTHEGAIAEWHAEYRRRKDEAATATQAAQSTRVDKLRLADGTIVPVNNAVFTGSGYYDSMSRFSEALDQATKTGTTAPALPIRSRSQAERTFTRRSPI